MCRPSAIDTIFRSRSLTACEARKARFPIMCDLSWCCLNISLARTLSSCFEISDPLSPGRTTKALVIPIQKVQTPHEPHTRAANKISGNLRVCSERARVEIESYLSNDQQLFYKAKLTLISSHSARTRALPYQIGSCTRILCDTGVTPYSFDSRLDTSKNQFVSLSQAVGNVALQP